MHKLAIFIILTFISLTAFAQKQLIGKYNKKTQAFRAADTGILVERFSGNRAAFMIKGKNPFNYNTNRVGFIDTAGRVVIEPVYINCSDFYKGRAVVVDTIMQSGMIDDTGKIIVPLRPQYIRLCENGLIMLAMTLPDLKAAAYRKDISIVDRDNHTIVPFGRYSDYATPHPDDRLYCYNQPRQFYWELIKFQDYVHFKKYIGVKKGSKWTLINIKGREIIRPKFDKIEIVHNDLVPVKLGKKFGVANISGKMVIPASYDRIDLTGKNYVYVYNGKKMGLLGLNNKQIIPIAFNYIIPFSEGFTAYNDEREALLFDISGKQIAVQEGPNINFPYWGRDEGGFFVYNSSGKGFRPYQNLLEFNNVHKNVKRQIFYYRDNHWGIMDSTGREITPPLYDDFDGAKFNSLGRPDQLIAVKKGNKWGIIDGQGKLLLSIIYDQLSSNRGKLFAQRNGKYGLFNSKLERVTPIKYDSLIITYPTNLYNPAGKSSVIRAKINNKWGLLNNSGKELIPCQYDELVWIYHNLALVKNEGKFGVSNLQGKLTTSCVYDDIRYNDINGTVNYNSNLVTKKDGLYGLINLSGIAVAPPIYEKIIPLYINFINKFQVTYHNKLGVLDGSGGKLLLPCEYDDLKFYNGAGANIYGRAGDAKYSPYITAFKNGCCGLIDSLGKMCLPFIYERIRYNNDDTHTVYENGKQGLVDKHMKIIIPPKYHYIEPYRRDFYILHTMTTVGLAKLDGQIIAETVYTKFELCHDKIILRKGNKFGTINLEGKVIDPFIYSNIECRDEELVKEQEK